jgi:hypothetical protein
MFLLVLPRLKLWLRTQPWPSSGAVVVDRPVDTPATCIPARRSPVPQLKPSVESGRASHGRPHSIPIFIQHKCLAHLS